MPTHRRQIQFEYSADIERKHKIKVEENFHTTLSSLGETAIAAVIGRFGSSDFVKFATALFYGRNEKIMQKHF